MIAAARADDGGDDDKGGLSPGAMDMDVDGEYLASFVTGSTTIIEEESDSEEDSGGAGSSFQPEPEKVTMISGNARPSKTRNGKRTLVDAIYLVLQDAGESLQVKEILDRIRAKKLYVFRRRDRSVCTDLERMRRCVSSACMKSPFFVRTAYGRYAIAKKYLNGSNTQGAVSTSPLRDAIYRVLQDAGGSLRAKEILGRIRAKKLYVFRRRDGSVHTDLESMRIRVGTACSQSPRFVRTERGTYAIAKESLNRSTANNLNEQNSNATTTNNNTKTMSSPSPSPYALDLREVLESGLMTEEEYAEAVQEAQRYDSKSPEKKREIADYNEALRIIFADASLKLSDKEQCIVKREYLEEVGLCKVRPPSSKRTRSKMAPSIVKVKQEE
ncbi:hypothetical protein A3770_02p11330 [Chloropicon primus]|uniref:HTH HARE-type domain-containing protein n=1 Tax=Chloropicon primus TaxID=1764295 RepID=A0A5B8MG26_9CHLO|nr:hypothetical protein A3770_02p11330 [Chloropicon primus]|eukprot:QDZ18615.1 hypothetical protein A3770_02p11330 [Chloropicon primus]